MTLGEIRLFAFGKTPEGWLPCDGRTLEIRSEQALYSLIGTTYGGDGKKAFKIPNLQGVTPIHQNTDKKDTKKDLRVGTLGGSATHSLGVAEMPAHGHALNVSTASGTVAAPGSIPAGGGLVVKNFVASNPTASSSSPTIHQIYGEATENELVPLAADTISVAGGSTPHENMQPYIVLNYCIAVKGDYPPRPE